MIQIALREVIINAIEHGNLNITFDEKSDAIENDTYFNLIHCRQNTPGIKDKKVTIEYTVNKDSIRYTISDEGKGFSYKKYLENTEETADTECIPHGRGLVMISSVFDEISFNDKGNVVTLVKNLSGTEPDRAYS